VPSVSQTLKYVADALSFTSVTNVCVFVCVFDSYYNGSADHYADYLRYS